MQKAVDISELRLLLDKTHKSNKKEVVNLDVTHQKTRNVLSKEQRYKLIKRGKIDYVIHVHM